MNKHIISILLTLVLLLVGFAGCNQAAPETDISASQSTDTSISQSRPPDTSKAPITDESEEAGTVSSSSLGNSDEANDASRSELYADLLKPVHDLLADDENNGGDVLDIVENQTYYDLTASLEHPGESLYYGERDAAGMRSGQGLALYGNGFYYFGDWANGVREGEGLWFRGWHPGMDDDAEPGTFYRYTGNISFSNDLPNGKSSYQIMLFSEDNSDGSPLIWRFLVVNFVDGYTHGEARDYLYPGNVAMLFKYDMGVLLPYHEPPKYDDGWLIAGVSENGEEEGISVVSARSLDELYAFALSTCPGFDWLTTKP